MKNIRLQSKIEELLDIRIRIVEREMAGLIKLSKQPEYVANTKLLLNVNKKYAEYKIELDALNMLNDLY